MYCPHCLNDGEYNKTKIIDTRQFLDGDDEPYVERVHKCNSCGESFYTIETYNRPATMARQNNTGV